MGSNQFSFYFVWVSVSCFSTFLCGSVRVKSTETVIAFVFLEKMSDVAVHSVFFNDCLLQSVE